MTMLHGRIRVFEFLGRSCCFFALAALTVLFRTPTALAQQTLGGIRGTVTDPSGALVPDTIVTAVGDQTRLTRSKKSNAEGEYEIVNLPIGTYTLTFTHNGFLGDTVPSILVQANRTATVNVSLKVGQASTIITVEEKTPLLNAADTTNATSWKSPRSSPFPCRPAALRGSPFSLPASMPNCPAAAGPTRAWATNRSGQRPARHQQ